METLIPWFIGSVKEEDSGLESGEEDLFLRLRTNFHSPVKIYAQIKTQISEHFRSVYCENKSEDL